MRHRRPRRGAVAGRAGGDRQPVRLDAGDQRPQFLYRTLFRHPRGAAHACAARHPAGLRQQERRGHRSRAVALSAALSAPSAADARSFRLLAHQLGRQGRQYPLDRRRTRLPARCLHVHRRQPAGARTRTVKPCRKSLCWARICSRCAAPVAPTRVLQPLRFTAEAVARSDLVKAQLDPARLRAEFADADAFVELLAVVSTVERLTPETATGAPLDRITN